MRIVQLIYSLGSGGAEKFVVNLSNELSSEGHEVCVCILRPECGEDIFNRQFLKEDVKFVSLNISEGFSLRKVSEVERFLDGYRPDVVHCHLNVIPYIFRYSLKHSDVRIVHTLHSVAPYASGLKIQKLLNIYFYKHGIIPVAISDVCADSFGEYYSFRPELVVNGSPEVKPSPHFESAKDEVCSICGGKRVPVFIHAARFHSAKNQSLLVESFNRLSEQGVDFRLIVTGRGFEEGEGAALKSSACDRIHFLGEKSNVGDYMLCSDAFCLTSSYEGLPLSLLEAMSCGLTPICTAVGGIPDVVQEGINGYLAEGMTCDSYCEAVGRYLEHPIDSEKITCSYFRDYSIEACAGRYVSIYKGR